VKRRTIDVESQSAAPPAFVQRPARPNRRTSDSEPGVAQKTAIAIARAALDKKAINLEIIDLVGKADYADYLVLMSATSDRHVRAIADEIQDVLRSSHKLRPLSVEGMTAGTWVLLDYTDVVVHVFQEATRSVFDIDGLWLDAARVEVPS